MTIAVDSKIEISLRQQMYNQQVINTFHYNVRIWPVTVQAVDAAEAWWNDIKATYRAVIAVGFGDAAISVRLRELNNPTGDYAEYDIPAGERVGTRANPAQAEGLPAFCAAATRLVVGSRATRPGQKRMAFLMEGDNSSGTLQASYKTPLQTFMAHMAFGMVLGAPAALVDLQSIVVKKDTAGNVIAWQPITGYIVNNSISTQNTRKIGRGA